MYTAWYINKFYNIRNYKNHFLISQLSLICLKKLLQEDDDDY